MDYKIYQRGQITKFEAGVIYRAYKNNEINCLPEFTQWIYKKTEEYIRLAVQRYNQDYITYDRIYSAVRYILNNEFDKANEEIELLQETLIRLATKNSIFKKYQKEED